MDNDSVLCLLLAMRVNGVLDRIPEKDTAIWQTSHFGSSCHMSVTDNFR